MNIMETLIQMKFFATSPYIPALAYIPGGKIVQPAGSRDCINKILPLRSGATMASPAGSVNKNMPRLLLTAFLALAVFACSKKKDNNKLPAPLQAFADSSANCTCSPFINEYAWKEQKIYVLNAFGDASIACDGIPVYYDKDGIKITSMTGTYDLTQFLLESKLIRTAWRCKPPVEY
jgi:hypothetical protein